MVQGPDVVALNALIVAMPPVCRAEPATEDGHELAISALYAFADAAVRTTLPAGSTCSRPGVAAARNTFRPRKPG